MKTHAFLVSVTTLAMSFAACGGSDDPSGDGDGDASGGSVGDGDGDTGDGDGDMGGQPGDGDGDGLGGATIECALNTDCDDDNPCTDEVCTNATCVYTTAGDSLCAAESTCVAEVLDLGPTTICLEGVDQEEVQVCMDTTCTGGATTGCDMGITFDTPTSETSVEDDVRTTIYTVPVTAIALEGAFITTDADCTIAISVEDAETLDVEVTVLTETAAMCGFAEEVQSIESDISDADMTHLVTTISGVDDDAVMCAAIDTAFEAQFGAQLRILAEAYVVSALGDLGGYVGAECGACEAGDCTGLACDPETL